MTSPMPSRARFGLTGIQPGVNNDRQNADQVRDRAARQTGLLPERSRRQALGWPEEREAAGEDVHRYGLVLLLRDQARKIGGLTAIFVLQSEAQVFLIARPDA